MLSTSRLGCFIVVLSALLSRAVVTEAQTRPLAMDFLGCEEQLSADALRIANIELASDPEASAATADARIVVQCETDAAVVRAARLGLTVDKRLSFDTFDAATRARLIALGVAELVRELARPPVAAPSPILPIEPATAQPKPRIPPWALTLGPALRYAPSARLLALGGRVLGERRIGRAFSLTLSAEGTTGDRAIRDGALRWNHAALEVGARAFATLGLLRLFAEAALAGGVDHVSGEARASGVVADSFSAANVLGRLGIGGDFAFLRYGVVALALDTLSMVRALRAENVGVQTIEIGPILIGATVAVGARW